jgi:WW domain-binding protein 4
MSEYWISKKKYFCTYCETYIADDAPSRAHHENGMRHLGNKERFVKGLYKAGERKKKDEEEERREMKNVEAAAQRAYALDVGAGRAGIGGSGPSKPTPKAAPPPPKKPSNPYANYTTAEFLGYKDPDAERIQAELERKRSQGVAGQWELVPTTPSVASTSSADPVIGVTRDVKPPPDGDITAVAGTKREADPLPIDDEDSRAWKLKKKTARLGEIYDPGVIPIKLKAKKEPEEIGISGSNIAATDGSSIVPTNGTEAKATNVPKWTKVEWKRPGDSDPTSNRPTADSSIATEPTPVKIEHDPSSPHEHPPGPSEPSLPSSAPKIEPASVKSEEAPLSDLPSNEGAGGSFFKKRKGKLLTGSAGRGRRDQF